MAGHRRIASRLYWACRRHPEQLDALLLIDHDASIGRTRSARALAKAAGINRETAARLLEAYAKSAHELLPDTNRRRLLVRKQATIPEDQRGLRLFTVPRERSTRPPSGQGAGHDSRGISMTSVDRPATHPATLRPQDQIRSGEEEERAPARPEGPAEITRRRAARIELGFPPRLRTAEQEESVRARAAELSDLEVARILAADAAARRDRDLVAGRKRTAEAMRHEGRRR